MNGTRTILAVVLSLILVLSALPAEAVSFIGEFCAQQINAAGMNTVPMTPSDTTFCFLSSVTFEETDTTGERAQCQVVRDAVIWVVEAALRENNDAAAYCCAICYNN